MWRLYNLRWTLLILGLIGAAPISAIAGGRYFPEVAVAEWNGERFTVQRVDHLDEDSLERQNLVAWVDGNEQEIEELQAAVRANAALSKALTAQSVQLNNIVGITRALNGNLVIYLR